MRPRTPLRPITLLSAAVLLAAAAPAAAAPGGTASRPFAPAAPSPGYALPGPLGPLGRPAGDPPPPADRAAATPAGHETAAPGHGPLDPVVRLAAQRLLVADEVAAAKRLTGAPADDPARDRAVLAAGAGEARALGADPAAASRLLGDQIAAATLVERALLAGWAADPGRAPAVAPPLTTLRATLDDLDSRLVAAWNDAADHRAAPGCGAALAAEVTSMAPELGLDELHSTALARALASVCR
ncbi:chorismate mutase [Streptantibioticus silvisoli]|uniref:Chorismate mutase n=1 Tax=Streptantibioticus silvisoli TaxID=2705255 RepID=A0ABT6W7U0_9ACTN|nr:chorismate mutase [Streptantibioticus silvisoli]MDI5966714.1 chorismate mutase [Streptantibioticus silvisoli]